MKLFEALGNAVVKVALAVIFFLFLVPIALLVRAVKGEVMSLSKRPRNTLWRSTDKECAASDLEGIW